MIWAFLMLTNDSSQKNFLIGIFLPLLTSFLGLTTKFSLCEEWETIVHPASYTKEGIKNCHSNS